MTTDSRHGTFSKFRNILHPRSKSVSNLRAASSSAAEQRPRSRRLATEHALCSFEQRDEPTWMAPPTTIGPEVVLASPSVSTPSNLSSSCHISPPEMTRMPTASAGSSYPVTPSYSPTSETTSYPQLAILADSTYYSSRPPPDTHVEPDLPPMQSSLSGLPLVSEPLVVSDILENGEVHRIVDEDRFGLSEVLTQINTPKPKAKRRVTEKAMEAADNAIDKAQEQIGLIDSVLDPMREAAEASGILEMVKEGLDNSTDDLRWLMQGLDEVAKLHPFIAGVVIVFKAAYTMEMTRRQNDKRIVTLYVAMKDMVSVLVQLRDVKDPEAIGPSGCTIKGRMQETAKDAVKNIKDCAADCDMYIKKSTLVKVLKGQTWQGKLEDWITTFSERKKEFQFALIVHTGNAVDSLTRSAEVMDRKLNAIQNVLLQVLESSIPAAERKLASRIEAAGGSKTVMQNDDVLRKLLDDQQKGEAKAQAEASSDEDAGRLDTSTDKRSSYTIHDLKNELQEDWNTAVRKNLQAFEGKFAIQQRQMKEDIENAVNEGVERVIGAFNQGPHELINNKELRAIWEEMRWRLNVKTRLFVMTVRDHLSDFSNEQNTTLGHSSNHFIHDHSSYRADEWAFQYISVKYLQPIMEAFDDDGTGYITVHEVNAFVNTLPKRMSWSLPRWIAYWAIGWQQAAAKYCKRILSLLANMHKMRFHALPINRSGLEYYLQKVWKVGFELCVPLTRRKYLRFLPDWLEEKFNDYVLHEEGRIRKNLEDVKYDLDALETVYIVAGPGRIEKSILPLLYLLLKRDIEIFDRARTERLNRDELWDSADSILFAYTAVMDRYRDLKTLFMQQKMDIEKQFQVYSCGMFEHIHNDASLFGVTTLANSWQFRRSFRSAEGSDLEAGHWSPKIKLLNHELDTKHPYSVELYDVEQEKPSEEDMAAAPHIQSVLGQWNGFVYNEKVYPRSFMMSFYLHASAQEGQDLEAKGIFLGVPCAVKGWCDKVQDGSISIRLIKQHSDRYDAEYFNGYVLPDGSYVGTQGPDENPSLHLNQFLLKRIADDVMCFRPSPREFDTNKPRALWSFATQAIRYQVLKSMWSWTWFAERRDMREQYIKAELRKESYGRPLKPDEEAAESMVKQKITALNANVYRSVYEYRQRILPDHVGCRCSACFHAIRGGVRTMCLDCQPSKEPFYKSVNLCDHPDCLAATIPITQRPELEKPHLPDHDVVRLRTVLQLSEQPDLDQRAKRTLKACRELFTEPFADGSPPLPESTPSRSNQNTYTLENPSVTGAAVQNEDSQKGHADPTRSMAVNQPHHEELGTTQAVSTPGVSFANQHGADRGFRKKEKGKCGRGRGRGRGRGNWHGGNEGGARHAWLQRRMAEAQDVFIQQSEMNRARLCNICHKGVKHPCWICVDCYYQGVGSLICSDCESKTLLRCIKCEHLYPQPSWYYGSQEGDTFMCNKCDTQYHPPFMATNTSISSSIATAKQHTYTHALVRFTLTSTATTGGSATDKDTRTTEEKVAHLDKKVTTLDEKVTTLDKRVEGLEEMVVGLNRQVGTLHDKLSQLEGHLTRVETGLAEILARLQEKATL